MVHVGGRPILDWVLGALATVDEIDELVFVGGYRLQQIRQAYPRLTYVENDNWEQNNILASLFYAEALMSDGFYCAYSDTVISAKLIAPLVASERSIVLALDPGWNVRHASRPGAYDAHVEATSVEGERVVRIQRLLPPGEALGEFTGVARFDEAGARAFSLAYERARKHHGTGPFHHSPSLEQAYLIDLLQEMIDNGTDIHYCATGDAYIEIDTVEDYHLANTRWIHQL
jgi:choline kinase